MMKHDSKNFLDCYKIIIFQINAVLVIFLLSKNPEIIVPQFPPKYYTEQMQKH